MGKYDKYLMKYSISTPRIPANLEPVISVIDSAPAKGEFLQSHPMDVPVRGGRRF